MTLKLKHYGMHYHSLFFSFFEYLSSLKKSMLSLALLHVHEVNGLKSLVLFYSLF